MLFDSNKGIMLIKLNPSKWLLFKKRHSECHGLSNKIRYADSVKLKNEVLKRFTLMSVISCMALEIYGDKDRV